MAFAITRPPIVMKKISILFGLFAILSVQAAKAQHILINGRQAGNAPLSVIRDNTCDTIFSFAHPELNPTGITFDGTYFWCNNAEYPRSIYRFDLLGQFVNSIPSPCLTGPGGGMDFDGTNILLCVEQDGILYKLDTVTGAVVTQFNLPHNGVDPSDPNNYGVAFDGTYLWHTEYSTPSETQSTLYKLDATSGVVLDSFVLAAYDLCIKFINGSLYGIDPVMGMLHKIDTTNGKYLSSEPWCLGFTLGLTVANNHVWGSHFTGFFSNPGRTYQFDDEFLSDTHTIAPDITCSLYPNPASDWMRIQLRDVPDAKLHIEIGNVVDQNMQLLLDQHEVLPDQQFDFNLSGFPAGIYMVKIKTASAQSLKVLIKL